MSILKSFLTFYLLLQFQGVLCQNPHNAIHLRDRAIKHLDNAPDSAIIYLQDASEILKRNGDIPNYLSCQHYLIEIYLYNLPNPVLADSLSQLTWELAQENLSQTEPTEAALYALSAIYRGKSFIERGEFTQSAKFYETGIRIMEGLDSVDINTLVISYLESGVAHRNSGDEIQAIQYYRKVLQMKKELDKKDHSVMIQANHNLGVVNLSIKQNDSSLYYFQKTEELLLSDTLVIDKYFKDRHLHSAYRGKALVFIVKNTPDSALFYAQKAVDLLEKKNGPNIISYAYAILGEAHFINQNLTEAKRNLKIAQDTNRSSGSVRFRDKELYILNTLGNVARAEGEFSTALVYYDNALSQLTPSSQPFSSRSTASSFVIKSRPLLTITDKVKCLQLLNKPKDLHLALNHIDLAIDLVFELHKSSVSPYSMLNSFYNLHTLLENGFEIIDNLMTEENSQEMASKAFYYMESIKSILLYTARIEQEAKMGLPDFIRSRESYFKQSIAFQEKVLFHFQNRKPVNSDKITEIKEKLFSLQQSFRRFSDSLESNYPNYYKQKYQLELVKVDQVQQALLSNQAFIQYYVGGSHIFALGVHPDQTIFQKIPLTDSLFSRMELYLSELSSPNFEREGFEGDAFYLYKELVEPIFSKLPIEAQEVIIVPDGILSYLPFEAFLTSLPSSEEPYSKLPFLAKSFAFSYTHSATHWFVQKEKTTLGAPKQWLGFAPTYKENQITKEVAPLALDRFLTRDGSVQLPFAHKEIEQISQLANGRALYSTKALESNFHLQADQYNIIHLATHGLIEDQQPMYSKLVFTPEPDSLYDGYLHAYEIYNMQLPADLVVLSACNTGIGKLEKGEGIMSLSRAFFYAGVKSLVMSLWNVSDESTSELMVYFYEGLEQGLSKDRALQQAKLRYLENQEVALKSHPYFWAGFVLKGNAEPVAFKSPMNTWIFGVLGLLLLSLGAGVFWIWKSRS